MFASISSDINIAALPSLRQQAFLCSVPVLTGCLDCEAACPGLWLHAMEKRAKSVLNVLGGHPGDAQQFPVLPQTSRVTSDKSFNRYFCRKRH